MIAGSVAVNLTANTAEFEKKLDSSARKTGNWLKQLKTGLGEESQFGGFFKILAGTGAVAGLHLAGRVLDDMVTQVADLKKEFDAGSMSAGEMVDKLARGLPIIGGFVDAGRKIHDLFSDEAQIVARIEQQAKNIDALTATTATHHEAMRNAAQQHADTMTQLRNDYEKIFLSDPEKKIRDAYDTKQKVIDEVLRKSDEEKQKRDDIKKSEEQIAALMKQRSDIQTKLAASAPSTAKFGGASMPGDEYGAGAASDAADTEAHQRQLADIATLNAQIAKLTKDRLDAIRQIESNARTEIMGQERNFYAMFGKSLADGAQNWVDMVAQTVQAGMAQVQKMNDDALKEMMDADVEASMKQTDDLVASMKDMEKAGQATFDSTRTPAERYAKQLEDLQEQLKQGAIDQETFNRAAAQAKDLMNGGGRGGVFESIDKANIDVAGLQDVNNDKSIQYQRDMAAYLKNIDDYLKAGALGQIS